MKLKPALKIGLFFSVVLLALNGCMYQLQEKMAFHPTAKLHTNPEKWNLSFESVYLTTADKVKIHGWYIPHANATKVILFFHGNGGNISHRRDSILIFNQLGYNVFIFDYRGYGLSAGSPNEEGLYNDARSAWNYLRQNKKFLKTNIILFGRSLGGAIAAKLASEIQPFALILESTFSSANDMTSQFLPIVSWFLVKRYDFNTVTNIKRVSCPVLVIHSKDDEMIPYRLGQKVFKAARQPKTFFQLSGDHNSGFLQNLNNYKLGIQDFLSKQ